MFFSCFLFQFFLCLGCAQDIHTYSVQYPSHMKMTVTESVILFVLDYCSLPVQQWTVPSPHQVTCLPVGTCASRILWGPFSSILSRKVCCVFWIKAFQSSWSSTYKVFWFFCFFCCWACLLYDPPILRWVICKSQVSFHLLSVIILLELAKFAGVLSWKVSSAFCQMVFLVTILSIAHSSPV